MAFNDALATLTNSPYIQQDNEDENDTPEGADAADSGNATLAQYSAQAQARKVQGGGNGSSATMNQYPRESAGYQRAGNTTSEDYFPIKDIFKSSTQDPETGTWNQYAPTAVVPYAAFDKNEKALQDSANATLQAAGELYNSVPRGAPQFQADLNSKYYDMLNDYEGKAQAQWGNSWAQHLISGDGQLGRDFHKDVSNHQAIAAHSEQETQAMAGIITDSQNPNKWVSPETLKYAKNYLAGASDIYKNGTSETDIAQAGQNAQDSYSVDAELQKLVPQIKMMGSYTTAYEAYKAASTNGHQVGTLTTTKAISDDDAKTMAAHLIASNPIIATQIHPDDLVKRIQQLGDSQVRQEVVNNAPDEAAERLKSEQLKDVPILNGGIQIVKGSNNQQLGTYYPFDDKKLGSQLKEEEPVYVKNNIVYTTDANGKPTTIPVKLPDGENKTEQSIVTGTTPGAELAHVPVLIKGIVQSQQDGKYYKVYDRDMTGSGQGNFNYDKVFTPDREVNPSSFKLPASAPTPLSGTINPNNLKQGSIYSVNGKNYQWDGKQLQPK